VTSIVAVPARLRTGNGVPIVSELAAADAVGAHAVADRAAQRVFDGLEYYLTGAHHGPDS
jgi:hypothetical protein